MRRISTPKRTGSKQKQFQKILPLTNLISTLMTTTSTDFYALQSFNTSKINASKYESPRDKQVKYGSRPQTTNNKFDGLINQKVPQNEYNSPIIESPQRRSFRPKSSNNSGQYKSQPGNFTNASGQVKQQNNFSLRQTAKSQIRKLSSNQRQNQYRVQYKLVQADNPFEKVPNKPPKSIQSNKSIGFARGYGVNSHKFHNNNQVCEGRILIIANLTKTAKIQAITSLYALFQSSKSILYIDFVRQHFQIQICKKLDHFPPPPITKQLIQSCLHKVQNKFCQMYNVPHKKNISLTMSITNSFGLSYSMVFIRNDQIIICTKGTSQAKISLKYGSKLQGQHSQNCLDIKKINKQQAENIDFIALVSEAKEQLIIEENNQRLQIYGLILKKNSRNKKKQISQDGFKDSCGKQFRNEIKMDRQERLPLNIHELMGNTVDSFYSHLMNIQSSKNASLILIAFKNIQKLLRVDQNLQLPYCKQSMDGLLKQKQTKDGKDMQQNSQNTKQIDRNTNSKTNLLFQ